MEVINDLVGYENRKIFQNNNWFCFSVDALLLANFTIVKTNKQKILDLGTGVLPIPLLLSLKTESAIDAVEIQKDLYELALKSLKLNKLEKQITLYLQDMKDFAKKKEPNCYDIITVNPPYFKINNDVLVNNDIHKKYARFEYKINIEDILNIAKKLLKNNGSLFMISRVERFTEIINTFEKNNIKVKKIQFIYQQNNKESKLFLIEGRKNANDGVKILKPLVLYDNNFNKTKKYKEIIGELSDEKK